MKFPSKNQCLANTLCTVEGKGHAADRASRWRCTEGRARLFFSRWSVLLSYVFVVFKIDRKINIFLVIH